MIATFFYAKQIERIMISGDFSKELVSYCPVNGEIVRQLKCDKRSFSSSMKHWEYLRLHSDWYSATDRLMSWVYSLKAIKDTPVDLCVFNAKDKGILSESLVLLTACSRVPEIRRPYHKLRRYATIGIKSSTSKKTVRLETCRIPEGQATSIQAFKRFIEAIQ